MKSRLIGIVFFFAAVNIVITGCFFLVASTENEQDVKGEQILAVNEIKQLIGDGKNEAAMEKSELLQQCIRVSEQQVNNDSRLISICVMNLCFLVIVFGYVYVLILRPFDKLKKFAGIIAQGDFSVPLNYERSNYFGDFTWAFDSMRREITKARSCEREAIENNKTVIATLSHDIKTPIASIRAYAEGLEANLCSTPERREKYLRILMRKCDEVSKLTNDLFLHSISDLDKLKISPEEFELCEFLKTIVSEIAVEQKDIILNIPNMEVIVFADKNRMVQITENLINNARKYAKSNIDITLSCSKGYTDICFRDYGTGIPNEDMPFIFYKFYRGKNCGKEQGSGLGLYIVKYIIEQMGGKILLHNHQNGLEAVVSLPVKN